MSLIPPTLMQFWNATTLPDDIYPLVQSWSANSGLDTVVYDEDAAREYIRALYGSEILELFDICALPAMKSDFFRMLYILEKGGWYADCSIECLTPPAFETASCDLIVYRRWHGGINNGLFAARPQSQAIKEMVNVAIENIRNRRGNSVFEATGPKIWNDALPGISERFRVLELAHADIAGKFVAFHQDLAHKKGGRHWSDQQKNVCIYKG